MSTENTESTGPKTRGVGRRSMVRAGVWSVPVVSIAAAAPALAASGTSNLSTSTCTSTTTGNTTKITVTLRNTGAVATTGLQVQASVASGTITTVSAPGWSFSGTTGVAASQVAAGGTVQVTFTVVTSANAGAISLHFTTSDGASFTC